MMRSLYSGVSGLRNHQTRMDVVGNNIANVNTVGYKAARTIFQDLYSQKVKSATAPGANLGGTNPTQIGLGVTLASIDNLFTASAAQVTGNTYDLMIQNDGFFVVRNGSSEFYTRAGNFYFDKSNYLVTSSGYYLQGFKAQITEGSEAVEAVASKVSGVSYSPITRTESKRVVNAYNDINTNGMGPDAFRDMTFTLANGNAVDAKDILGNPVTSYKWELTKENTIKIFDANNTKNVITIELDKPIAEVDVAGVTFGFDSSGNLAGALSGLPVGTAGDVTSAWSPQTINLKDINGKVTADGWIVSYLQNGIAKSGLDNGTGSPTSQQTIMLTSISNPQNFITVDVSEYYQRGSLNNSSIKFQNNSWNVDSTNSTILSKTSNYVYTYDIFETKMSPLEVVQSNSVDFITANGNALGGYTLTVSKTGGAITVAAAGMTPTLSFTGTLDASTGDLVLTSGGIGIRIPTTSSSANPLADFTGLTLEFNADGTVNTGNSTIMDTANNVSSGSGVKLELGSIPFTLTEITAGTITAGMIWNVSPATGAKAGDTITLTYVNNPNFTIDIVLGAKFNEGITAGAGQLNGQGFTVNYDGAEPTVDSTGLGSLMSIVRGGVRVGDPLPYVELGLPGAIPNATYDIIDDPAANILVIVQNLPDGTPQRLEISRPTAANDFTVNIPSWGMTIRVNENYQAGDLNKFSVYMDGSGTVGIPMGEPICTFSSDPTNIDKIYVDPLLYNVSIDEQGFVSGLAERDGYITDPTTGARIFVLADQRVTIGQVVVATFDNQQALEKMGDNLYSKTSNTGEAQYNKAGTNGAGKFKPGALEMSNVDLSQEFTDMIVTQRGFQANSRIITVSDTLLEELINLKR